MELFILPSSINYQPQHNELLLTENDFHPCKPFFIEHNFIQESITKIKTKGVFETIKYIRQVLKVIDYLLEVGGEIYIEFFRASFDTGGYPLRPLNYLMNEISLCYKDRYKMYKREFKNNIDLIWLKKINNPLPAGDLITRWSFGIVSDGRKNERVLNIIKQITEFQIPEYEILICGPAPAINLAKEIKVIDDNDLYFDVRIPISKKKNRIIDLARFNNLIIMHDRISFEKDWYTKMVAYGNCFDQICCPIFDESTKSIRINDWSSKYHDDTQFEKSNTTSLKYYEWDRNIYVDGGFMLLKKHIILKCRLDDNLNWGEMEDVNLSERLYLDGNLVNFYADTNLLTQTHRIKGNRQSKNWFKAFIKPIRSKQYEQKRNKSILLNFRNFLKMNFSDNIQQ